MKSTWAEDREYIVRKYKEALYEAGTGISNEDIKKGVDEIYVTSKTEDHAMVKAKAFDFILSNTRIDVSERDWYVGIAESRRLTVRLGLNLKWYDEVRANCVPLAAAECARRQTKSHSVYLDPFHHVPDWHSILKLGIPGLLERAERMRREREEKLPLTDKQRNYFDSIKIEYESMLRFLARVRNHAISKKSPRCEKIAQCIENLYTGAPTNTYECLQLIWLYFIFSQYADGFYVRSFGNLDVMLYPYYARDIESGEFTKEDISYLKHIKDLIDNVLNERN